MNLPLETVSRPSRNKVCVTHEREILFRVLQGPQGWMLLALTAPDSALSRVRDVIGGQREHYAKPVNRRDGCQDRDNEPVGVALLQARRLLHDDAKSASSAGPRRCKAWAKMSRLQERRVPRVDGMPAESRASSSGSGFEPAAKTLLYGPAQSDPKRTLIRKKRGCPSGMDEDNILAFGPTSFPDQSDQACEPFAGIDWIEW